VQIYLIRHPRPRDVQGYCYGRRDVAVDRAEIASAALQLRRTLPDHVLQAAPIYTSPLSRCVVLARAIAGRRATIAADELIEMDFGTWEGRAWDAVPRAELDGWAEDVWGYRPGGGENAQAVAHRWHSWLQQIRRKPSEAVIAVTHAGFIRVALAQTGVLGPDQFAQFPIAFGSVQQVQV